MVKKGSKSFADLKDAELNSDRAKLQLANVLEQLKIYQSVAKEFGLKEDQSSAAWNMLSGLLDAVEVPNREDTESKSSADSNADRNKTTRPRGLNAKQKIALEKLKQAGILKPGMTGIIGPDGTGLTINSPSAHTDPKKSNDDVVRDAPSLVKYSLTTDPQLALDTLQMVLEGRDAVRMQQDQKTGAIVVMGRKEDHQLVSETLATLESPQAPREQRNASQPLYKGKPFAHWINITKNERSPTMLCDALRAGAELAETAEDKAALLEVTRTLARKHGTADQTDQYYRALIKAIRVLAPAEMIQFVLDELEHGTSQSVEFCSSLFRYTWKSERGPIAWTEAHDNAFVVQAPKLLQLVVAQIEEGGARASSSVSVLRTVVSTLIGHRDSRASFAGGGKKAYVSGVTEKRVSWANEKNPTLAPDIRQLFLDSSADTKPDLVRLTRAFWPNNDEIELALQSSLFDLSTIVEVRDAIYSTIVGQNKRETYRDFLASSPKPIAVQFLKKLLDNQLGPENQRIVVMEDSRKGVFNSRPDNWQTIKAVAGRPATILNVLSSTAVLMQKHPNDTDEDVTVPIRELIERIVEIEETDNPTLKQELDDFKGLEIFRIAKKLLEKTTEQHSPSPSPKSSSERTEKLPNRLPKIGQGQINVDSKSEGLS